MMNQRQKLELAETIYGLNDRFGTVSIIAELLRIEDLSRLLDAVSVALRADADAVPPFNDPNCTHRDHLRRLASLVDACAGWVDRTEAESMLSRR